MKKGVVFEISTTDFEDAVKVCENTFLECTELYIEDWIKVKDSKSFQKLSDFLKAHDISNQLFTFENVDNQDTPESMETCYQCNEECKELYQVKRINRAGKMSFEKVCSEVCANDMIEEFSAIHQSRAEDMRQQMPQRLR